MMTTQSLNIPEEILDGIVQCLDPQVPEDLQTLVQLSQTSKGLQRLVEPLQYRHYPGQQHVNPHLWLKAVLARPGREQLVQHLVIHEFVRWRDEPFDAYQRKEPKTKISEDIIDSGDDSDDDEGSDDDVELLTSREVQLLSTDEAFGRLNDASIPDLHQLIRDAKMTPRNRERLNKAFQRSLLRTGSTSIDLVVSLLVLLCPDLKTIDIWTCDSFDQALIPSALTCRDGSIAQINLRRKGQRDDRGQGAVETLGRLRIFERRNVEYLNATNDDLRYIMDPGGNDPFGPWPMLKHISLSACSIPNPALIILLQECPNLTSLELRMDLPLEACGDILREYGRGIERLTVDADSSRFKENPSLLYEARLGLFGLGNLRELSSLRKLEVAPWTLISMGDRPRSRPHYHFGDLLPSSLRTLIILPFDSELGLDLDEQSKLIQQDTSSAYLNVRIL